MHLKVFNPKIKLVFIIVSYSSVLCWLWAPKNWKNICLKKVTCFVFLVFLRGILQQLNLNFVRGYDYNILNNIVLEHETLCLFYWLIWNTWNSSKTLKFNMQENQQVSVTIPHHCFWANANVSIVKDYCQSFYGNKFVNVEVIHKKCHEFIYRS